MAVAEEEKQHKKEKVNDEENGRLRKVIDAEKTNENVSGPETGDKEAKLTSKKIATSIDNITEKEDIMVELKPIDKAPKTKNIQGEVTDGSNIGNSVLSDAKETMTIKTPEKAVGTKDIIDAPANSSRDDQDDKTKEGPSRLFEALFNQGQPNIMEGVNKNVLESNPTRESMNASFYEQMDKMKHQTSGIRTAVKNGFNDSINNLANQSSNIKEAVGTGLRNINVKPTGMKEAVKNSLNGSINKLASQSSNIKEAVGTGLSNINVQQTNIKDAVKNGITESINNLASQSSSIQEAVGTGLTNINMQPPITISDAVNSLQKTIQGKDAWFTNTQSRGEPEQGNGFGTKIVNKLSSILDTGVSGQIQSNKATDNNMQKDEQTSNSIGAQMFTKLASIINVQSEDLEHSSGTANPTNDEQPEEQSFSKWLEIIIFSLMKTATGFSLDLSYFVQKRREMEKYFE